MRTILLAIFLFSTWFSFTQDYTKIDSIVSTYPNKFESIEIFTDKIKSDFKTDIEKVRATYYWISNNVRYDYKSANNQRNSSMSFSSEERLSQYQKNYAEKAMRRRLAVCEGYSQLLKFSLERLNIKCVVISGFAKTTIRDIGWISKDTNHAWNAVFLDNKWQLIDATWSTGSRPDRPNEFSFRDVYFLINPKQLIWSHRPENDKWQLLNNVINQSAFFYAPIIHAGYYNSGLELTRMQGLIKPKENIQIAFDTINQENQYYYQFSEDSLNLEPITFVKEGEMYIAQIPYNKTKGKKLVIFSNYKACLSFKII